MEHQYVIGIDLGTTNCTLAYIEAHKETDIQQFSIPQMVSPGIEGEDYSLPSFIYFPTDAEHQAKQFGEGTRTIGLAARDRGKEVPDRLIASAKSWLCHQGIDRREPLLPLSDEVQIAKISPLEACTELLTHLKHAWDAKMTAPFSQQKVLITVPASFDPSARQLVIEAAHQAEYPEVILLEEPQAAFYAWLQAHEEKWRQQLSVNDTILVIDIGGGTTDFSLIQVKNEAGDLGLHRLAVGSHLLLGGDNIDYALGYLAKQKLEEEGHNVDDWQLNALVHACREAKERFFSNEPEQAVEITIMGRGSRLIGRTLKTHLSIEEAYRIVLDGFFPMVKSTERSTFERRAGIQQIGLPFAQDARVSCQLAKFLSMTGEQDHEATDHFIFPTAVLFNGGTTKPPVIRERLLQLLNSWGAEAGHPAVKELKGADYDFAVSRGAAYYERARQGKAIRIKSGTSCSYFIGVEDARPAIPGVAIPMKALCIAPFGMEEGTELQLNTQEFALVVGEPTTFRFFSHATPQLSNGQVVEMGDVVRNWKTELTELHPIETHLPNEVDDGKTIRIRIHTRFTELGMLEVWCVAADGRKWKLEFDIRKGEVLV